MNIQSVWLCLKVKALQVGALLPAHWRVDALVSQRALARGSDTRIYL